MSFDHLPAELHSRAVPLIALWQVDVDRVLVTPSSLLAFGRRIDQRVVVKMARVRGDEWRAADVLRAFAGRGTVRVYDAVEGAALLERLDPGEALAESALDDEDSIRVIAETISAMSPEMPAVTVPTAADWGAGFARYRRSGDAQVPADLVEAGAAVYLRLCGSQSPARLLHGDLHHGNILRDARRGWVAIDPKGVIGEPEYEAGAALRNPWGRPDIFANRAVLQRRIAILVETLGFDEERLLAWAFAQAVLSAVWDVEDGIGVDPDRGCLALARTVRPMLSSGV